MREKRIFILLISLLCVQCHLYTDANVDSGSKQHCKDDTCVTDEGPCFIPREKGILTRLDGVKVSYRKNKQNTFPLYIYPQCIYQRRFG